MGRKTGQIATAALMAITIMGYGHQAWAKTTFEWEPHIYKDKVEEKPLKLVIESILQWNKKNIASVRFSSDFVDVAVTYDFDMPAEAAFEKVLYENKLDYIYDASNKVLTVTLPEKQTQTDLYTPKDISLEDLWAAIARLKAGGDPSLVSKNRMTIKKEDREVTLIKDNVIGALFIEGPASLAKEILLLSQSIDKGAELRSNRELTRKKDVQDLEQQRMTMEMQSIQHGTPQYKIVPLRYANVTESTRTFQGKSVTIPGILQFLKNLLGSEVEVLGDEVNKSGGGASSKPGQGGAILVTGGWDPSVPRVSVDPRTNSVIIQGPEHTVTNIENLIRELDQPEPVVEIEVMILEGEENLQSSLGIDWTIAKTTDGGSLSYGESTSSGTTTTSATTTTITTNNENTSTSAITVNGTNFSTSDAQVTTDNDGLLLASQSAGTFALGFLYQGSQKLLELQLNSLKEEGMVQTISAPKVVTLNNMPAKIASAQNLTFQVVTNEGMQTSLQTVNTGITLDITPTVIEDNGRRMVRIDMNASSSQPVSASSKASESSSVETNEEEVQTSIIIPENGTYIMGGMFKSYRYENDGGLPLLKDIPLLGYLFGTKSSQDTRNQVVFMLTPRVYDVAGFNPNQGRAVKDYVDNQKEGMDKSFIRIRNESHLLGMGTELREDE